MSKISAKYQKDFKNMDYQNPRLIRDRENRTKRIRKIFILLALVFLSGLIYFLFFSPPFRIEKIEINGLEKIKKENIDKIINDYRAERRLFIFSNNNFWLFRKNAVQRAVYERYYFEKFTIKKRLPNRILINLKEKESAINWLTNNLCYHLDLTGLAIEYCEQAGGFLAIKDLKNHELKIGEWAVGSAELKYIVDLFQQTKKITEGKLNLIHIEKTDNLFDFITEQGIVIKMNANLTIDEQTARLDTLLNQPEIKENLATLKYIDLRFGEKVYYK